MRKRNKLWVATCRNCCAFDAWQCIANVCVTIAFREAAMENECNAVARFASLSAKVFAVALVTVASLGTFAAVVKAQGQTPPLSVKPLSGGVYWTQGGAGGNTGIIVGKDGVI